MSDFESLPQRIRVKIQQHRGCWLWTGATCSGRGGGYGNVKNKGKTWKVHRLVWTLLRGKIPAGMELDHTCEIRNCCNPDCMELVTRSENERRKHQR